jgi:4-aminobutyrate aminotransferase-like enzyme
VRSAAIPASATSAASASWSAAGVIVLACGPDENVLRLVPPLTVSDDEIDQGLAVLIEAVRAT